MSEMKARAVGIEFHLEYPVIMVFHDTTVRCGISSNSWRASSRFPVLKLDVIALFVETTSESGG